MTYNDRLADEIIGIITTTPERHNNSDWLTVTSIYSPAEARADCRTTACVAGWAAILTAREEWRLDCVGLFAPDGRRVRRYYEFGRDALGITNDQAEWLFNAERAQEEILWGLKWLRDHPDANERDLDSEYEDSISGD